MTNYILIALLIVLIASLHWIGHRIIKAIEYRKETVVHFQPSVECDSNPYELMSIDPITSEDCDTNPAPTED